MTAIWNGLQEILGGTISFFYDLIPNLGVAIILLTIAVGIVLFPLTLKQTRSMKAMQELQPEVKRLQREYKDDRQTLQEQTMALYRERGVNPAAGCLPLLLQMPIWFALFSVLRSFATDNPLRWIREGSALFTHIEQGRQLDFLWMDLSITPSEAVNIDGLVRALPYLITILIVMGTAYWQQRQTMARNPQQDAPAPGQALLKIFPVFFGFISFTLPAGLVVYFAASQIFRIGQQALILGMDGKGKDEDGSEREEAPPGKQAPPAKESRAPKEKPQAPAPRPKTQRPQGSKKRRGKRRRRK